MVVLYVILVWASPLSADTLGMQSLSIIISALIEGGAFSSIVNSFLFLHPVSFVFPFSS